jgi:hypothetical protein
VNVKKESYLFERKENRDLAEEMSDLFNVIDSPSTADSETEQLTEDSE